MEIRDLVGVAVGVALSASVLVAAAPAARAAEDDDLARLATHNPGITRAELTRAADEAALIEGKTRAEVIKTALAEAEASAAEAKAGPRIAAAASGGSGTVTLGPATKKGDIFVSPASTLFIEHGHTGIYSATSTVVEAPGTGKVSRSINAYQVSVGSGAVKQHVEVTQAKRDAAADYAYNNLRGKAYNVDFAYNRDAYGSKMNCSQLVWAAYLIAAKVDLDSNGGLGVYPYNIKDSGLTTTYATL